jgi:hypothetical protein
MSEICRVHSAAGIRHIYYLPNYFVTFVIVSQLRLRKMTYPLPLALISAGLLKELLHVYNEVVKFMFI